MRREKLRGRLGDGHGREMGEIRRKGNKEDKLCKYLRKGKKSKVWVGSYVCINRCGFQTCLYMGCINLG